MISSAAELGFLKMTPFSWLVDLSDTAEEHILAGLLSGVVDLVDLALVVHLSVPFVVLLMSDLSDVLSKLKTSVSLLRTSLNR